MLGDIVALVHNDLEHEDFEYYLLVVTDSPTDAGDTMGGLFLEPQSGKSGPGVFAPPDQDNPAEVEIASIIIVPHAADRTRNCARGMNGLEQGPLRHAVCHRCGAFGSIAPCTRALLSTILGIDRRLLAQGWCLLLKYK